ncbi:mycothiol transferase [Streptomyces sp. NBC_01334]
MTADTPLTLPDGRPVLFHMIKEHARLNGHAGILRESIGGVTGA